MNTFGFELKKPKTAQRLDAFALDSDGAVEISQDFGYGGGGVSAYFYDLVTVPKNELELVKTYRTIANSAEIDLAINEIRNEMFIFDVVDKKAIELYFTSESKLGEGLRKKIQEEYDTVYALLNFTEKGVDIFSDWYIDGRLYVHKIVDSSKPKNGIQKTIVIDPTKIKKVKELPRPDANGIYNVNNIREFYVFSQEPDGKKAITPALEIHPDSITYIDSGLLEKSTNTVIGHLHKAIVPYNNMKLMEDSLLIYRVSRAPERRVIYVDVGNLPKNKAEAYMKELMNKFRNKLVYDSATGSIVDRKNVLSMLEDYWLPRREGKGTQIDTLPGGTQLGVIEDVEYFRGKLYAALNVPLSRFSEQPAPFTFGKGLEIERDEYRFKKFINRLRQRFLHLFYDLLKTQLILKNIIVDGDWEDIKNDIQFVFTEDNAFVEYKESEIINNRLASLTQADAFVGKYLSKMWAQKNILRMSDKDIKMIEADNKKDRASNAEDTEDAPGSSDQEEFTPEENGE